MVCVMLVVAQVVSTQWGFVGYLTDAAVKPRHVGVAVGSGCVTLAVLDGNSVKGWVVAPGSFGLVRWWPYINSFSSGAYLWVPLWIPFLLIAIPTVIAWRRDRRPKPGHCRCGYDLTGNVSGVCPECGEVT